MIPHPRRRGRCAAVAGTCVVGLALTVPTTPVDSAEAEPSAAVFIEQAPSDATAHDPDDAPIHLPVPPQHAADLEKELGERLRQERESRSTAPEYEDWLLYYDRIPPDRRRDAGSGSSRILRELDR